MPRRSLLAALLVLLAAFAGFGKNPEPMFKNIAVKPFVMAEGVELPPDFPDLLVAELKAELKKSKVCEQVIGADEVVDAPDLPKSLALEGRVTEYKKGNVAAEVIIGFGAGRRHLKGHISVANLGDKQVVYDQELDVAASSQWKPQVLANFLAKKIAGDLKKKLGK